MEDLRDILIKKILKYSKEKSKTFFLDCDVGKHTRLENHEVNYMNLGICEQNAVSIAAGLSTNKDNIVIVSSFAEFIMEHILDFHVQKMVQVINALKILH